MEAQQGLHKAVQEQMKKSSGRQRQVTSREQLLNFAAEDYVRGGKDTAAGIDAKFGEHVDRSLASFNGR